MGVISIFVRAYDENIIYRNTGSPPSSPKILPPYTIGLGWTGTAVAIPNWLNVSLITEWRCLLPCLRFSFLAQNEI